MATVTNRKDSQAYKSESVWVFLDATDSAQLANFHIEQACSISGASGTIDFIDLYGHSFRVQPNMPTTSFNTDGNPGYLTTGTVVTVS